MNSRNEWTVFRETMSFYGVAHDRLRLSSRDLSRGGPRDCSPCHSLDQLRAGRGRPSDRGLARPAGNTPACRKPQPETIAQSITASVRVSSQAPVTAAL